jgi:hypothetical protein
MNAPIRAQTASSGRSSSGHDGENPLRVCGARRGAAGFCVAGGGDEVGDDDVGGEGAEVGDGVEAVVVGTPVGFSGNC